MYLDPLSVILRAMSFFGRSVEAGSPKGRKVDERERAEKPSEVDAVRVQVASYDKPVSVCTLLGL